MKDAILKLMLVLMLVPAASLAAEDVPFEGALGTTSLNTETLVEVDFHYATAERRSAILPEVIGQFGFDYGAAGVVVQMLYEDVKEQTHFGGVTLFGKLRHCAEPKGTWTVCYGGQLDLSLAPWEESGWDDWVMEGFLINARPGRTFDNSIVVTPHAAFSATNGTVSVQAYLGPDIWMSMDETEDLEATLSYGLILGVLPLPLLSTTVGLRGLSMLTFEDFNDSFFLLDLTARLHIGTISPSLTVSIPLDVDQFPSHDVVISAGLLAVI